MVLMMVTMTLGSPDSKLARPALYAKKQAGTILAIKDYID
jgi:hypothetical protein